MQEEPTNEIDVSPLYSEFAYDDAFRTMETECDDIVIPFVNYFYNENYDKTAVITRMRNEHFIEHQDKTDEKRITDSHFTITYKGTSKKYHWECESKKYDGSLLVKLFEYDSQVAVDTSVVRGSVLRVNFPNTGLLLLRKSARTPDTARIILTTPGGKLEYDAKIAKFSDYTIDSIFAHRLYLLIPFYIFNYEKQFKAINKDSSRTEELAEVYKNIIARLDKELQAGNLSAYSYGVIIRLTHKVLYKLTIKHKTVQEKVGGVMGGKVLDLPEVRLYHQGVEEGRKEGLMEGLMEGEAERNKLQSENAALRKELETLKAMKK
ncbi:hypothetical protein [Butyrivibrio sp. AE3009]|uniref:hypothetical protein n=1 Tax=Butyrivibrio sp. AE3009 TaxID=1280666 RepID=UPI0003B39272|nr:hypothetical protein [Butyrivibrio sp. AE3009]